MTTSEPVAVKPAPVFDLDLELLGAMLVRLPAVSATVGHASLKATLGYGSPEGSGPEAEFFRDTFQLSTAGLVEKWYGGQENASRFWTGLVSEAIAQHRKPRPAA